MNKITLRLAFLGALLLLPLFASAQVQCGDSLYSVRMHVGYAFNKTYSHFANFDLGAFMPINQHFEMQADARLSTTNCYAMGVQLRPKFDLPVGQMYVETRAMYRALVRNHINEITTGISLGYRMQYVDVLLGCGTRIIGQMPVRWTSTDKYILEPFNILYRIQAFVRPQTSPWNLTLAVSNIDDYQMERVMQPMFMLGGQYDADRHWRVRLSTQYKPTGMFHLTATFYAIDLRAGVEYRF